MRYFTRLASRYIVPACRALFQAPPGWAFVISDQANLQDRAFAHYLAEFDDGKYAREFLSGTDQHWQTAIALGQLPMGQSATRKASSIQRFVRGQKRFATGLYLVPVLKGPDALSTILPVRPEEKINHCLV
jgi:hypothetical protein